MKIKKALACVLAVGAIISSISLQGVFAVTDTASTGSDDGVMRDDITAKQIADEMGLGINLGNTMEGYWLDVDRVDSGASIYPGNTPQDFEQCWGAVVTTQDAIDGMKAAGFNTVRIPVYWGNMMEEDGTFTINPKYIGRVKEIVDYCRNAGVYAVINIHHYDEFVIRRFSKDDDLDGCANTFKHLWTQIAEYFKDYSDYLVFEGFNEYLGGGPLDANGNGTSLPAKKAYLWTNTLNQAFVDAVRTTGGNNNKRVLIASGYYTNIDNTTKADFKVPEDSASDRLMVSVHYVDNSYYWMSQIGNDNWIKYSLDQLEKLNKAFTSKGIPVFIGETTAKYDENRFAKNATIKESSKALDYMLRLIKSYEFVPVLWDTNDNFYSRTDYVIKSNTDADVISNLSKELSNGTFQKIVEPSDVTLIGSSEKPSDNKPSNSSSEPTKTPGVSSSTTGVVKNSANTTRSLEAVKKDKAAAQKAMKQAKLTSLKVKSKAKKINVSWKKVKKAKGYQVQVSAKKNFKKVIFKKDLKKTKLTIKNKKIKSKKTYFVRVRAYATYKNANNKAVKVYSKWNKQIRKVKVK